MNIENMLFPQLTLYRLHSTNEIPKIVMVAFAAYEKF
jgi:hypothetical protein